MVDKRPLHQTSIIIEKTTRENLKHIARKDQTYDALINELIRLKQNEVNA